MMTKFYVNHKVKKNSDHSVGYFMVLLGNSSFMSDLFNMHQAISTFILCKCFSFCVECLFS